MLIENKKAIEVKVNFHLKMSLYALVKFYLRGIDTVSFAQPLIGKLQQAKIDERVAVEIIDPEIGRYVVIAVRKTQTKGVVVTGWKDEESKDIGIKARELLEMCYQIIAEKGISSWDIKKERKWLAS